MHITTESTTNDINIPRVVEVNQETFVPEYLLMVGDAAITRIIKENGGDIEKMQPTAQRIVESIKKAVYTVLNGNVLFTAYASHSGEMYRFAISSLTRPKLYIVDANNCQCESQLHNGYCVHRSARQLFADYFKVIRADEDRARVYAQLGIQIKAVPISSINTNRPIDIFSGADVPYDIASMLREMFNSGVGRPIALGPSSLRSGS